MSIIRLTPTEAWRRYISPAIVEGWMEDSKTISDEIRLSKRELFALLILAHLRNHQTKTNAWKVAYNPVGIEPNDGFVTDDVSFVLVEHKVIPQMAKEPALAAILETYAKYAKRGTAYGSNRVLVIFANKASRGLVKTSSLHDEIGDSCPFDQVLLMHCVSIKDGGRTSVIHITEQYPGLQLVGRF